jgi:glycine/D-amino acid oxidase-like deaminating enzyme
MTTRQRAVLVGAGITGTLTALQLLDAGFDVTLVEASWVGAGSSSRTAAGIRQQFSTPGTVKGMRYSVRWYAAFRADDEPSLLQNGYLFLHADPEHWADAKERVAMQHEAGLVEVEALERDDLVRRFPWVSDALIGGTYCPTDGFLRPEVIYGEAARRAVAAGATLLQHAPVTGAVHAGGRLIAVQTPKGRVEGDLFFDCTNAWTDRTGPLLGGEPLPVDPLKRYLWFIKREGSMAPETLAAMPLTIAPTGVYCRPENEHSLLIGKKHETPPQHGFADEDQDAVEPAFDHRSGFDSVPYQLWMELADALPPVGEFGGINATTCGFYGTTPDHNPFLAYDRRVPNLIRLVGFSGHGAMFGPFTALIGRRLAEAGRDLDALDVEGDHVPLTPFHIGRTFDHSETMVI